MFDLFATNPMWSVSELTLALNRVPYVPQLIGRLGLFREERLSTTSTMVEVRGERLALVPELPRGAPPTPNVVDRAIATSIAIPHFPIRDTLIADAVQNVRAFGTDSTLEGVQTVVNQRMASMSLKLDVTLEYVRLGAVRGKVVTAVDRITGAPLIERDLFRMFNFEPNPVLEWPIIGACEGGEQAVWCGQLTALINQLGRAMSNQLPGGMFARIHCICGYEFFDAFMQHPELRAAFIAIDSAPFTRPQLGTSYTFRDLTIEEYRGRIGGVDFVAPDTAYFFPEGVPDLFIEAYAPADYMETVNTVALPRYARSEMMDFNKGIMLEAQMNVMPFCSLPSCLFTAKATQWTAATGGNGNGNGGGGSEGAHAPLAAAAQRNAGGAGAPSQARRA